MSDAFITADQYNEILKRLGKLEHKEQYKEQSMGKHEDVYKDVEELKKNFPNVEKDVAVNRTKFDSLEEKIDYRFDMMDEKFTGKFNTQERIMNEKFNTMNEKFNSLEKRFMMMWVLQTVTFLAILGLYLKGIIF
ncbi:MAG: hypothetical protein GW779_07215 [Candidatus Altiarchaeum hamiconexum]|uniref:DUF1640 domain-containing protein n=1 Tax=Candidatus Altarchaeum hamiconexum TaxID=1803513 RepID=A0A8J7Z053_9ARCH|nr:hypothetical protein [Candidatus Altarchaeum hamiconexum]NCS92168.1 hypothetical protein [Candidatus Altarchaeum hamiconexum]OIQ06249.1 MAG: hypothetical protein AUK59_00555 [Candidatus Altarchaeum sp. CG2_30_32_3053]